MVTTYFLNGCEVQSELRLPCNAALVPPAETPRMPFTIRYGGKTLGTLSQAHWVSQRFRARCYDIGDGLVLSVGDEFQMVIALDGRAITLFFDPNRKTAGSLAAACAINLGMACSALLRGELSLHAASAELDGHLIGIMAPSGTGKTTLLWSLLDHGARLHADDMTTLREGRSGQEPLALPSTSLHAKLGRDELQRRGMMEEDFEPMSVESDEFWVPIEARRRRTTPLPLTALFVLKPVPHLSTVGRVQVERAASGHAVSLLNENMQGLWMATSRLDGRHYMDACVRLARRTPIYVLEYHRCYEALPTLVGLMRELAGRRN
jgi:hypothetical protein